MIGALNSVRILASQAFEAAGMAIDPFKSADAGDELSHYEAGYQAGVANERAGRHSVASVATDDEDMAGSSSEITYLDEIAHHLAAQTPLLEDIRNLLNASAAPGLLPHQRPAAAAERPAPDGTDYSLAGAGHLTATPQCLRVAARGLRQWIDGDACSAPNYWRSIAASLDAVASAREAITDITK